MVDLDFAQSTFEYILRKAICDGRLPGHGQIITSEDHYYEVDWRGVNLSDLWDQLIDEREVCRIPEDEHFAYFTDCINNYIDSISIIDVRDRQCTYSLGSLISFKLVHKVPKKYYRT